MRQTFARLLSWEMLALAALLVGLFTWQARADVTASVGIGKGVISEGSFERAGSLGYVWNFSRSMFLKPEVGGYITNVPGRSSSGFASLLVGFRVSTPSGLYAFAGAGPTYLVSPDNKVLSGHLQYNLQGGICFRDEGGVALCWKLQHFSNCHGCPLIGGPEPNIGIDLIAFEVAVCIF